MDKDDETMSWNEPQYQMTVYANVLLAVDFMTFGVNFYLLNKLMNEWISSNNKNKNKNYYYYCGLMT